MRKKQKIWLAMLILSVIVLLLASICILKWYLNNRKEIQQLQKMSNQSIVSAQNTDFLQVDFLSLQEINNSVVGWLKVEGTEIDYPIVQTNNNSFYLTHSFNKNYNPAGWPFLDYRNSNHFDDQNNIIYAHSQTNRTMFGTLKNVLTEKWFANPNNHIIKTSTATQNSLWQVFSVYTIPTTTDYLQIDFDNDFSSFANKLIHRSIFDFHTDVKENDKILTLSTCYNKTSKTVLHAKLIATQPR